jgi:limonene-1,2-epoxide hydrolase
MNSQNSGEALQVAKTYVEAIARRDVDTIISVSADDIVCTSPIGRITGTQRFREFHAGFARMIKAVTVLATYGDDQEAVVVYSADTHPVADAIVAELLKVKNGKIASTDVIYDATPFAAYMATRTQAQR